MKKNTVADAPRYIAVTCAALVLLTLAGTGCHKNKKRGDAQPAAVNAIAVRTRAIEKKSFERRLTVQGTIEAKTFANIAARVAGNLDAIWVDEGDSVVAGETRLFQIDPVALSNAVLAATQDLEVFKAGAKVAHASRESVAVKARKAQLDQARYARLHKEGRVSDNEFENIDTLHEQAKAAVSVAEAQIVLAESQVSRAEAALKIAQKNLDDTSIVAPLTGVVSKRDVEPGEQMAVGHVMMTIVDPASLEAAAFIPAQYYNDITPDQTHFRLAINGLAAGSFPIYYRSPTINPSLRTFEVKGKVTSDAAGVVPGSMADITLIFETRETLAVPSAAILERNNGAVVFVVRDGKAWQTPITTGLQNDGCTEVLSGLDSGAEVVYEGQVLLRDGSAVAIQ